MTAAARTAASSIPATAPPATARSPTATATAASSSSSSGGRPVPAPSSYPPYGARCDAEPLGQLVAAPAAADSEQGQQAKQALSGHRLSLPQIRTETVRVSR